MTLRLKINLIVGALTLLFAAAVIALQLRALRDSVHEEVVAANRVASQLLLRTAGRYTVQGTPAMLAYLQGVGRIRSNDITLLDTQGRELYRSPPSPYKAGRDAPPWRRMRIASTSIGLLERLPKSQRLIYSTSVIAGQRDDCNYGS